MNLSVSPSDTIVSSGESGGSGMSPPLFAL